MYFWRMAIESVALVLGFFSYSVIGQIFYDPKVNLYFFAYSGFP